MKLVNIHKQIGLLLFFALQSSYSQAQVWSLQTCVDSALSHNKSLQMVQNEFELAEYRSQETKAALLPKVFFQGDYRYFSELPYQLLPQSFFGGPEGVFREVQFGVPHTISTAVSLQMPIYDPQVMGAIATQKVQQDIGQLQVRKTQEQVVLEVSNLYYTIQIAKNQLAFVSSNLENSRKLEHLTQLLYEQELAARTDWDKVILQVSQLETNRLQLESQIENLLQSLRFVMGVRPEMPLDIDENIAFEKFIEEDPVQTSDLLIQEQKVQLSELQLKIIRNSKIPKLSLYGSYGQSGFGYGGNPESFLKFFPVSFVGAQVSFPIFNGTVSQKKIQQSRIGLENARLQEVLVQDQREMLLSQSKLNLNISENQIATYQSQVNLAESVYKRMLLQHQEGLVGLTDVLLAENSLRESQQLYIQGMVDYLKATLQIKNHSGTLLN
ncbi:MAG: TolC family protein [Bacteroidota bacterium]